MKVLLKRTWFAGGRRVRPDPSGVEVPAELEDQLPKDAVVIEEETHDEEPPATTEEPQDAEPESESPDDLLED